MADPTPSLDERIAEAEPVRLRDGTAGWVIPLLPTDREALVREFETLSPETKRHRFLGPVVHLSEEMLHHLVDEVDGVDHVALVLMAEASDDLVPVGIARWVRYPDQPHAADVAVTIKDAWQGRGAASALMEVMMRRRPVGVTHIVTDVAADNPASLAMLRRLGPTQIEDASMGVLEVEVDLDGTGPLGSDDDAKRHTRLADPRHAALRARDLICPWLQPDPAMDEDPAER